MQLHDNSEIDPLQSHFQLHIMVTDKSCIDRFLLNLCDGCSFALRFIKYEKEQ